MATDSTGADISSSIVVVDVTPCAAGAQCPACAITFAAAGLCQPGPYLYLYRSAHRLLCSQTAPMTWCTLSKEVNANAHFVCGPPSYLYSVCQVSARSEFDHDCCRPDSFCPTSRLHVVHCSKISDSAHVAQHTLTSATQIACSLTAVFLSVQGQGQLCLAGISMAAGAGAAAVCCQPLFAPHSPGSRLSCCSGPGQHPDYWQQRHQPHCFCCCCWSHFR